MEMDRKDVKIGQAMPRKSKEAKYLIEEQRTERKKTDLFARFRRLIRSAIKKDLPPGVKIK